MAKVYYIGGSPCSGKSTVAEVLSKEYGLYYFKVDDYLEKYTKRGESLHLEVCEKQQNMSSEQIWMRNPSLQCEEELKFYEEIFDFVMEDLKMLCGKRDIITEGASYMPNLMKKINIQYNNYLSITPTREFQISHYSQREWIKYVLDGCTDKQEAFENWMDRDCLFARKIEKQCDCNGYYSYVNGGERDIKLLAQIVSKHFGLEE